MFLATGSTGTVAGLAAIEFFPSTSTVTVAAVPGGSTPAATSTFNSTVNNLFDLQFQWSAANALQTPSPLIHSNSSWITNGNLLRLIVGRLGQQQRPSTLTPFATFCPRRRGRRPGGHCLLKCGDTWTTPYLRPSASLCRTTDQPGLAFPRLALRSGVYTAITFTNCGSYSVNGLNIVGAGYVFAAHAQLVLFRNTNNGAYSNIFYNQLHGI